MTGLPHALAGAALIVLAAMSLDASFTSAWGDDVTDCTNGSGDTRLRGCSSIIRSGRLFGKPISRKNLAIIHNNRGNAYNNRGIAYKKKDDFDLAIADYGQAIKLNPKYASAYNNRAWSYFKWGKASKGLPDANKAIALDPKYVYSYDTRAHIYEALDLKDAAIADFRKALELDPSNTTRKEPLTRLGAEP